MTMFSIVIPSFNRPDFLDRLLKSISSQTFRDYEVIVVDDASLASESYERLLREFSSIMAIRMLRNEVNHGAQFSRNRGVTEARGELIAFVDDDDEWLPTKLERQAAFFRNASENTGLLYTWADAIAEDGAILHNYREGQRGNALSALLDACFIPSPTVVVRRRVLEQVGGFDEALHSCQDWDMWTRITNAGYDMDVVTEVLALHHKHKRASIGTSPRSLQGFFQYYSKHTLLYKQMGMTRNLSEKYRGLAQQARRAGDHELAKNALRSAVNLWKGNWKAWIQFAQAYAGKR